jgi:monoterpene epsilon-lactone hydrolase
MPSPEHEQFIRDRLETIPRDGTIETARQDFEQLLARLPAPPDTSIKSFTIDDMRADWVTTTKTKADRAILYFHGGAYMLGSNVAYRNFAARLSDACKARVLLVDYRLAPEQPFPAAVEDGLSAYRWMLDSGINPREIIIGGDSAGGGLTLATLIRSRDEGLALPRSAVLYSPWTDLECTGNSHQPGVVDDPFFTAESVRALGLLYAGDQVRNPLASPMHADLSGLPALLIFAGTREILLDDATRLAAKARESRVSVQLEIGEGLMHAWPVYDLPESRECLNTTGTFLDGIDL